jgi:predicted acyl esterase
MVHGYGDNKETLAGFCHDQAQYGYYTSTFSVRGQGNSGGLSNLISITEAQDLIEYVSAIKRDSVNGSNPNNILIMGGSQGGLLPFMAACNGMNVKTIISALAPPNFASSWIENGCIKMTLLWTISYTPDTARYNSQVTAMSNWIYANNKNKWDSLAYWLPVNRDFMAQVPNNRIPLIIEGSWQDKFFNASGIMQASTTLSSSVPFRLYLGAVQGHGGDHSATEDTWHMQFFNDWFFYWLFGVQNGTLDAPKYQFAYTTLPIVNKYFTFVHDSSLVPLQQVSTNYRLYFGSGSKLNPSYKSTGTKSVSFKNAVSSSLTMQEAVDEEFKGPVFNSKFKKASIYFETAPLTSNFKMLGIPKINLDYLSTAGTFCQFNFQIYEVTPSGSLNFVNRINYTDRNYTANSRRVRNFQGQAHAHTFKAGNKIRVVLTNLDTAPIDTSFLGSNPFVLPVLNNGTNNVFLSTSSYIDLPMVAPVAEASNKGNLNNSPQQYTLNQNYPNPFNPSTSITYSIASAGMVELKVYDILGREVKTLVNEFKAPGSYSINFDASGFASGVYFYKIISGNFNAVKRMILVK